MVPGGKEGSELAEDSAQGLGALVRRWEGLALGNHRRS